MHLSTHTTHIPLAQSPSVPAAVLTRQCASALRSGDSQLQARALQVAASLHGNDYASAQTPLQPPVLSRQGKAPTVRLRRARTEHMS